MEDLKYIKIQFRKGDPVWLSLPKWEEIIKSEQTLVPYKLDNEEQWTGRTLNKAEVVRSEHDKEFSEKANQRKFHLYRRISDNTVVKCYEGELPDDLSNYEKLE